MSVPVQSFKLAPLRFPRGGVPLALAAAAAWLGMAEPSAAQVRTHGEGGGSYSVSVMSWRDIPFRTVVRQQYDYSCGSAAVATLLRYHYNTEVNESEVFAAMFERGDQERIRSVGFSMLDMRGYLEAHGFSADGLRLSLDRLASLDVPAIALITHDGYRHFVVVKGVNETQVLVGDPTLGLVIYTREEFQEVWNGVVLAIRAQPEGATAPTFNADREWQPWSTAPLDAAHEVASPSELMRSMPEFYQITPVTAAIP